MERHDFLSIVHKRYRPRNYLEIGVFTGQGLARSTTRTIGVDPEPKINKAKLARDLKLVEATSDEFFAQPDAISWFPEGVIDLTFIDGLHIFEFVLRDFMNAERLSAPSSVVIFDDVLPRSVAEAARNRHTMVWTGDTYKILLVLERYRPDLVIIPVNTKPTGTLLVLGLDPTNTVLVDHYDEIVKEYVTEDPQSVPREILHRSTAADPKRLADSQVWQQLAEARESATPVPSVKDLRSLRGTARFRLVPPLDDPWPPTRGYSATRYARLAMRKLVNATR